MLTACRVGNAGPISARGSDGGPPTIVARGTWGVKRGLVASGGRPVVSECEAGKIEVIEKRQNEANLLVVLIIGIL